ncbi:MAG: transglycosylase SLT domain-containing protein [Rehaibacterium terrae]|uniref:transglycosylase SLT domain-containing protein n=1 Tax=Rehaibacterium terrae TaxID=1341696 RepID=UPI0039193319
MSRYVLLSLVVLIAGCAASGAPRTATVPPGRAVDALYQRLDAAGERYRSGLEQVAAGEVEAGREAMRAAASDMQEAAIACTNTAGCDSARFFAAYDALLATRDEAGDEGLTAGEGVLLQAAGDSPLLAHLPEAGRSINLLNGRELRDIIELNGPVKAALTEWLTWMRPQLVTAWENYQYMRHLMWPEYEQAGLPEALLFGILAKESGGRVHAVSRAGASGPLQFMPATGLRYGLGRVDGFDTRFDPRLSARASVLYLNDRFAEFNHNLELALAAYNGGEGRMGRLYRQTGGRGFWDARVYSQLPAETREYVPMVLAAAWLFLHPEDYGLEFPAVDPRPATVALARSMSINELAICIGNAGSRDGWFRVLRNLNPRFQANAPIPAGTELAMPARIVPAYQVHCVDGARGRLAQELGAARMPTVAASAASPAGGRTYVVKAGDSLAAIARRHQCASPQALAQANGIKAPAYLIKPGQRLRLEGCRA